MLNLQPISIEAIRAVRQALLKPGLPPEEAVFAGDDDLRTLHLGALEGQQIIGIASFIPAKCWMSLNPHQWQLRGMATIAAVRNHGIGGQILEAGIALVQDKGGELVWCNGRTRARSFYERHSFVALGDEFNLPHTGPHFLFVRPLPNKMR